jgi:hypothetical protein
MAELKRPAAAPHGQGGDLMKMFEGPAEESLAESQRLAIAAGRNAFKELDKLMKAVGLYGFEHQGTQRFRGILHHALQALVPGEDDTFEVVVGPYELTLHDQPVYQNAAPEKNFIYKFFQDGVRRLRFHHGLTEKELDDFVDVLLTNWDDPAYFEDDSVTVMWSKDFEHITYKVIESFREDGQIAGESDGYSVETVVAKVKAAAPPETIEVAAVGSRPGLRGQPMRPQPPAPGGLGGLGGGAGGAGRLGQARKVDLASALITDADMIKFEESPFAMDEHEFGVLRQIVESTGSETLEKFIEILFKVGLVEDVEGTHDKVMTTFDRIVELLLGASRVGDLERVMMKVRGLTGPEGDLVFENLEAINRIFDRWGTAELITRIAEKINDPHIEDPAPLLTLLRLQNPGAAAHIARAAGIVTIPERRAAVFELLPEIIPGQLKEIARILQTCDATHAHDLIRVLRSLEGIDILTAINGALNNPDAAVRLEALGNLPPDKLHLYLQYIINALKDKSKVVRGKAVHLLARMPSPQVHGHLLQRIRDKDFAEVDLDEKRRFFAAASLTGNPTEWFMELLDERSFLQRKGDEEMRGCAAIGLALRMHGPAVPVFEREKSRKLQSDVVRESVQWAIQHVRQPREERTRQLYDILFKGTLTFAKPVGTLHE